MGLTPMRVKCPHQRTSGLRSAKDELGRHRLDDDLGDDVKSGRYSTDGGRPRHAMRTARPSTAVPAILVRLAS
jgi:hypothetical protein